VSRIPHYTDAELLKRSVDRLDREPQYDDHRDIWSAELRQLEDLLKRCPVSRDVRQRQSAEWVRTMFGEANMTPEARATRLMEEAIELAQACDLPREVIERLTDHVYSKEKGEIGQEIGGVSTTLLALGESLGYSVDDEESKELVRVLSLPAEHWRKRHSDKADAGIAEPLLTTDVEATTNVLDLMVALQDSIDNAKRQRLATPEKLCDCNPDKMPIYTPMADGRTQCSRCLLPDVRRKS
jgi:NTP pyrophosphatase (non-canonical NTP hydrolase)